MVALGRVASRVASMVVTFKFRVVVVAIFVGVRRVAVFALSFGIGRVGVFDAGGIGTTTRFNTGWAAN
jgi:hypothetical protein